MAGGTAAHREHRVRLHLTRVLGIALVVVLYYASQWLTDAVTLSALPPLSPELASVHWVTAIDHHLVQLLFALVCIGYLSRGQWRS